jgi:hypothetical protein
MTLLSEASFLVTPNGYKEDKLYAAIPTNGNGDMTFTRATTATRVNEAGLVELVPYNLLLRSEQFNNTSFIKGLSSVTPNTTTAPDGTLTADTWTGNGASGEHYLTQLVNATSGTTYTQSVFVKKGTNDFIQILGTAVIYGLNSWANFDLNNGVVGLSGASATATITDFGNGWYRCTMTATATATASGAGFLLFLINSATSARAETNSLAKSVHLWGAQLVEGSSALTYQKTVDRLDIPRIDYTGGGCPSILLEPQRTNLLLRSQELDNAIWTKPNTTISANAITAPDGTLTADKLVPNASLSAFKEIWQNVSTTTGQPYTFSIFAKAGEYTYLQLIGNGTGFGNFVFNVDLSTGLETFYDPSSSTVNSRGIINYGNGWYKVFISVNAISTSSNRLAPQVIPAEDSTRGVTWTSDGTSGFYLWGAQVEAGAYPTSYIPTTTASVTRNADAISKTGISDLIGQTEGVLFVESAALFNDLTQRSISISDGTGNNRLIIYYINYSNQIFVYGVANGVAFPLGISYNVTDETEFAKIAVRYRANDITLWVNGEKRGTDITSQALPLSFNRFGFDSGSGGSNLFAKVKSAQLYKTYLSNDEMAALTTL